MPVAAEMSSSLFYVAGYVFFKTSRTVLANQEIVEHMVKDIEKLDSGNNGSRQTLQSTMEKDGDDGFDNECKNAVYLLIVSLPLL